MVSSLIISCAQEEVTKTVTNTTTTQITTTDTMTSTTTVTSTTTPPVTTTIPTIVTAGELASFGGTLYNKNCTYIPDCHARFEGGGGDIQLNGETISQLDNAETVYEVISSIMHIAIGDYEEDAPKHFTGYACNNCQIVWKDYYGEHKDNCPYCNSTDIASIAEC